MATFRYPQTQTTITGGATEAKQDDIIVELQNIEADIETGNLAQATATKQDDIITQVTATATNTADNATETTLSALNTKVTAVDTTGKATEAKQDDIITQVTSIASNTTDAATETTLSALNTKVTAVDTTGKATEAKQDSAITELQSVNTSLDQIESDVIALNARLAGNLVPETFDHIDIAYVAAGNGTGEIETVIYKTGGAAGTTVATLTLAYDASDRLNAVTRS